MLGAIMPEPLAMPPTTYLRSLVIERVGRELGHAIGRHDRLGRVERRLRRQSSCATARSSPRCTRSIGSGTPMTPVEATTTCRRFAARAAPPPGARSRARRARRARRCTRSRSRSCRRARASPRERLQVLRGHEQRRGLDLVGRDRPTRRLCGSSNAISARSRLRGLMPACTPARRTPGTAPTRREADQLRTPVRIRVNDSGDDGASIESTFLRISEHDVEVLHRPDRPHPCRGCRSRRARARPLRVRIDVQLGVVGADHRRDARRGVVRRDPHERAAVVSAFVRRRDLAPRSTWHVEERRRRRRACRALAARRAA